MLCRIGCDKGRESRGGKSSMCGLGGTDSLVEGVLEEFNYK